MTTRTTPWPPGTPCWVEVTAPDVPAAKDFYAAVLGWKFTQFSQENGGYSIATHGGVTAAGLGPAVPDWSPVWTLFFATEDVDATVAAVTDAGGALLSGPVKAGPLGRMALVGDPSGAAFGLWQAAQHLGSGHVNAPGGLTWEDLRSSDPDGARAFYARVFGYTYGPADDDGGDYRTFHPGEGRPELGGMGGLMGLDLPSHWLVYFGVADTDVAAKAAMAHDGTVVIPPFDSPFGRLSGLADPSGAPFMVIQVAA